MTKISILRRSRRCGKWKLSFIRNWGTFNLGVEWRHAASIFGIGLGPFLFTVERTSTNGRKNPEQEKYSK